MASDGCSATGILDDIKDLIAGTKEYLKELHKTCKTCSDIIGFKINHNGSTDGFGEYVLACDKAHKEKRKQLKTELAMCLKERKRLEAVIAKAPRRECPECLAMVKDPYGCPECECEWE